MATLSAGTDSSQGKPAQADILRMLMDRVAPVIEGFDDYPAPVRRAVLKAAADFASDLVTIGVLR